MQANAVELATELTIAWLENPNTRTSVDDVPAFLRSMHDAVSKLGDAPADVSPQAKSPEYTPVVSVRKSLADKNYIISLIDGKPYKTLRRHLTTHGMTPEDYRTRYNLKSDYPMVAESYSESRRAMAKSIGLGRKSTAKVEAPAPAKAKRASKAVPQRATPEE
ncbi:MucR family transcriptional regulator [Sphingomonas sp. PB2P19]|uniref:MucR family transcriptional regulator n=1 Tax=Sphingomonas rhamnosi TaxID=3096156 RepID=UPI002FC8073D